MGLNPPPSPQKRALGRGLSALIPQAASIPVPVSGELKDKGITRLPIESVRRDTAQPRKSFDDEKLKELAESIRAQGVIQPVLVRKDGKGGYVLIAGERRWRAAQLAGLKEIPALVRDVSEAEAFQIALVENLQRADLNPLEEADGYRRLVEEFKLTQEQVAQRVGKDRTTVANALRLLALPDPVKAMVRDGSLSPGHARALLGVPRIPEMVDLARRISEKKLSVREAERLVKDQKSPGAAVGSKRPTAQQKALVEELQRLLGTKVRLVEKGGGKGTLEIEFYSYDDLDRLLKLWRR
ncbi:MAG: ParB/RepB/Spo0J family partition protein [Myxococcaceae bacterium]|nr:ParB/RepB/Spo0J family partition protein [Myxococcaceae bacterium]